MRNGYRVVLLSCLTALCLQPRAAMAWHDAGHEAVALVAYDQLTPAQRKTLTDILEHHPRRDKDLLSGLQPGDDRATEMFIVAAAWPDIVRTPTNPLNHNEHHPVWHYVDYPYDLDGKTGPVPVEQWDGKSDPVNLLQAMQKNVAQLATPQTAARQALDLCWIFHMTGDIHQPLHAISVYSNQYPDGDRGGNLEFVKDAAEDDSEPLHFYWDDLPGSRLPLAKIREIADRVEQEHPIAGCKEQLTKMDPKDWAMESFAIAKEKVYRNGNVPGVSRDQSRSDPGSVPVLSAEYQADAHTVADQRVAIGGYRLAALLTEILPKLQTVEASSGPTTMP